MDIQLDGFADLHLLGEGGFSRVYRARQLDFDRLVAIKILDVGLDERQREAFQRECRAMGVVSQHPNIVTVLSATFTADGRPAIVMELYGGGTYADRVSQQGPLVGREVLEAGIRVCGALQTAHDRGLLHRDVKPQNLFLSDYGEPALGDFGISTFVGEDEGAGGLTIHYAAPEVIERQTSSPASDVYSLAATLYTIAAGRRPFAVPGQQLDHAEVALRILREPPPRIGGNLPRPVERAILQGLAKRPEDRPASAASFGRLLQAAQEELGASRTELAVARTPVRDETELTLPGSGATGSLEEETATVVRPTSVSREVEPEEAPASGWRRWSSVAAGAVAVLALGAVVLVVDPGPDEPDDEVAPDAVASDDDLLVLVQPPEDIEIARRGDVARVSWTAEPDARYQVERVDGSGQDPVEIDLDHIELTVDEGERPCVVVRTIAPNGRLSPDSPVVCDG